MIFLLFLLGTHEISWLGRTDVPLFISHRRLARQKRWPRALAPWALDSGGFSELTLFGRWMTTPAEYVEAVLSYVLNIGNLAWAAIQDWMCEPFMIERTGLSIAEHQARTVASYLKLSGLWRKRARLMRVGVDRIGQLAQHLPLPWAPVLQGYKKADYHDHVRQYAAAGVDLGDAPVVGVGSICRRQATDEAADILGSLAALGLRLHAFGLKTLGLRKIGSEIASADSMAWSLNARKNPPLDGCRHKSCANCLPYALRWRDRILADADVPRWHQPSLFGGLTC